MLSVSVELQWDLNTPLGLNSREERVRSNPEPASGDLPRRSIGRIEIALVLTLLVAWVPGFLRLSEVWSEVEYASHGFLVPLVALWAATAHREVLRRLPPRPMRGGLILLGAVALAYLVALAVGNATRLGVVDRCSTRGQRLASWLAAVSNPTRL